MSTPLAVLWTLLSLMVGGTCTFSFLQPFWVIDADTRNALGMYSYCIQNVHVKDFSQECGIYGGYFHFSNLPSNAWQAACVLYGGGSALMCLTALLAIVTLCLPHVCDKRFAVIIGYIQVMAVITMMVGLLIFPVGLNSKLVKHYCLTSRTYYTGTCQVGWGYMLAITGAALAIFCPFLSHYTDMNIHHTNDV